MINIYRNSLKHALSYKIGFFPLKRVSSYNKLEVHPLMLLFTQTNSIVLEWFLMRFYDNLKSSKVNVNLKKYVA